MSARRPGAGMALGFLIVSLVLSAGLLAELRPAVGELPAIRWAWSGFLAAMSGHLAGLGWPALWIVGAWGAGRAHGWIGVATRPPDRAVLRLLTGWGMLGLLQIGLGFAGLLQMPVFVAETTGFGVLGLRSLVRQRPWRSLAPGRAGRLPFAVTLAALFAIHLLARLPDGLEDAMVYHLAWPEEICRTGRITVVAEHVQWRFPKAVEALAIAPWGLGGIVAAKAVGVALAISLVPVIIALVRALGGASGWWAAAFILSAGIPLGLARQAKNDLGGLVFATGAAWGLVIAIRHGGGWWVAAGWFAGCAINSRLTAGLALGPLALLAAWAVRRRLMLRPLGTAAVAAFIPFGVWGAAQWYAAGNPVVPFGTGVFPDLAWLAVQRRDLDEYIRAVSGSGSPRPSEIVIGLWRGFGLSGVPVVFMLLPFALLGTRGRTAILLKLAGLAAYLIWLPTERNGRFLLPVAVWVAALAEVAAGSATRFGRILAAGRPGLGIAALIGIPVMALYHAEVGGVRHLLALTPPATFAAERFTTYDAVRGWCNAHLPDRSGLVFTGDLRRLGFRHPVRSVGPADAPPLWRLSRDTADPARLRTRLRQTGATHLLHNFVQAQFRGLGWYAGPAWSDRQLAVVSAFGARWMDVVRPPDRVDHRMGGFYVFALRVAPRATPTPPLFVPGSEGRLRPAFAKLKTGDRAGALAEADRLLRPVAGVREAQFLYGYFALHAGRFAEAERRMRLGIDAGFVCDRNLPLYALAAWQADQRARAKRAADRAFALDPSPANARLRDTMRGTGGTLSSLKELSP